MNPTSSRMDSDLDAIYAVRDGDESALVSLMNRYRDVVFRLAYRYTGNAHDAQCLTEETFTKVYFNAAKYKPRGSVKNWIFAIAANHCRDFLRREKRRSGVFSLFSSPREDGPSIEDTFADSSRNAAESAVDNERLDEIQQAIQSLPEKLRFPFVFCVLEGHSQDEAAEVMGASRKTVELRIYRARKVLRDRLSDEK